MKLSLGFRPSGGLTDSQLRVFRRWVLVAGAENLLAFPPLVPPRLHERFYGLNNKLNDHLGLGGAEMVPPDEAINKLYVNLSGTFGSAMGALLIHSAADLRNRWQVPLANAVTRFVYALLVGHYARTENMSRSLLLPAALDLVFSGVFIYYASKLRRASAKG